MSKNRSSTGVSDEAMDWFVLESRMLKSIRLEPTTISVEIGAGTRSKSVWSGGHPGSAAWQATADAKRTATNSDVRKRDMASAPYRGSLDCSLSVAYYNQPPQ